MPSKPLVTTGSIESVISGGGQKPEDLEPPRKGDDFKSIIDRFETAKEGISEDDSSKPNTDPIEEKTNKDIPDDSNDSSEDSKDSKDSKDSDATKDDTTEDDSKDDDTTSTEDDTAEDDDDDDDRPLTARTAEELLKGAAKQVSKSYEGGKADEFYKQMSNPAREFFQARLKDLDRIANERNELRTKVETLEKNPPQAGVPANWFEHEQAFMLTPEYQQYSQAASTLDAVVNHYQQQLAKINRGEDWQDLTTDAQGNVSIAPNKLPADDNSLVNVTTKLQRAISSQNQVNNGLQQVAGNYKAKVQEGLSKIKAIEQSYFPQYNDTEKLKDNKHYKAITDSLTKAGLNNNVLYGLYTKLYTWAMELADATKSVSKSSKATSESLQKAMKSAGPSSSDIGGSSSGGKKPVTVNDVLKELDSLKEKAGY